MSQFIFVDMKADVLINILPSFFSYPEYNEV